MIKKIISSVRRNGLKNLILVGFRILNQQISVMFPKKEIVEDGFQAHSNLIEELWGSGTDISVGIISPKLLQSLKSEFCNESSFMDSSSIVCSGSSHPILLTDVHSESFLENLNKNIIAGNMHQYSYSNETIKHLHDELRLMFARHVSSPFIFVNTRIWKTKPGSEKFGPNEMHTDGFAPGHVKIMVYLTPLNDEFGKFKWQESDGDIKTLENKPSGTAILFKNSDIKHAGIPGLKSERIAIEVTLMRSLVNGDQTWPGHFYGRHFKTARQLNNISEEKITINNSKNFQNLDLVNKKKVYIGSGRYVWPDWISLDELDHNGVTKVIFNQDTSLPFEDKSISLFYSSHFFEHIPDEIVRAIFSEIKRTALPNAYFVLKIPDYSWFLEQYKFSIEQSMDEKGVEPLVWTWGSKGIENTFENRLAMMFCGYWNFAYGDHFSGNIDRSQKDAFHGPPCISPDKLKQIYIQNSPNEIVNELKQEALKDANLKTFNHQNAWSEAEMIKLLSEFDISVIHTDAYLICDQFKDIIHDIEKYNDWSAYYLCKIK